MEPFIVLFPLFGALLAMPVGRSFGPRAAELTTTIFMLIAALSSWAVFLDCLLYTSPSPRDQRGSRMPSSA